jgi:predicted amidophosphoribosyltransferase
MFSKATLSLSQIKRLILRFLYPSSCLHCHLLVDDRTFLCSACMKWVLSLQGLELWCRRCLKLSQQRTCHECYILGWWDVEIYPLFKKTDVLDSLKGKALSKEHVLLLLANLLIASLKENGLMHVDWLIPYPSSDSSTFKLNKRVAKKAASLLFLKSKTLNRTLSKEYADYPKVLLISCRAEDPGLTQEIGGQLRKQGVDQVKMVLLSK